MFKKDRYSIFAMAIFLLLLNPFSNLLGITDDYISYIFFISIVPFVTALLYLSEKIVNNQFLTIFLKALKVCWIGYFLYLIILILTRLNFTEGLTGIFNSFATHIPNILAYTFILFVPLFATTLIAAAVAMALRKKMKPKKNQNRG